MPKVKCAYCRHDFHPGRRCDHRTPDSFGDVPCFCKDTETPYVEPAAVKHERLESLLNAARYVVLTGEGIGDLDAALSLFEQPVDHMKIARDLVQLFDA